MFDAKEAATLFAEAGGGQLDFSEWLVNSGNVFLAYREGCFGFGKMPFAIYDCVAAFNPQNRGQEAILAARAAAEWMFVGTECERLICRFPHAMGAASRFCAHLGMSALARRRNSRCWSLAIEDWRASDAKFGQIGEDFLWRIQSAGYRDGGNDEIAFVMAGRFVAMAKAGNVDKAVDQHNRMAVLQGGALVVLRSRSPLLLTFGEALIQYDDDDGMFDVVVRRG